MSGARQPIPCAVCGDSIRPGERIGAKRCPECRKSLTMHYSCEQSAARNLRCLDCKPRPQQRSLNLWGNK
jgi:predicted nucleic acid-binding Zn ribbon protein